MKSQRILLAVLCMLGLGVRAQIEFSGNVANRIFLLQESIPVSLTVSNNTGETLVLGGEGANARLHVSVMNLRMQLVRRTDEPMFPEPWVILNGTDSTREFDLSALYQFTSAESYRATAVLSAFEDAWELPPYKFELVNGQLMERARRRAVDRSFHLRMVNRDNANELLLQVMSFDEKQVFRTYRLDQVLTFFPPEMKMDAQGGIHVLFYKFAELMVYARFSPAGVPLSMEYIQTAGDRPVLVPHEELGFWVPAGRVLESPPETP